MVKSKRGRISRPSSATSAEPFFPPPVIGETIPFPFGMGFTSSLPSSSSSSGNVPLGAQILPVANLPADFDGVPTDGSQYLGLVRREAGQTRLPGDPHARDPKGKSKKRSHPARKREEEEELQYQKEELVDDDDDDDDEGAWDSDDSKESDRAYIARPLAATALETRLRAEDEGDARLNMPRREWRDEFVRKFANMREALSNSPIGPISNPNIGKLPPLNSRGGWFRFLHGYASPSAPLDLATSASAGDQGGDSQAEEGLTPPEQKGRAKPTKGLRMPSASLLRRFNTDHILALLSHMPYWMPQPLTQASSGPRTAAGATSGSSSSSSHLPPCISSHHSLWLFSLLSVLDGRLTSDEISELRTLARCAIACLVLRRSLVAAAAAAAAQAQGQAGEEGQEEMERGAWIVIAAIAGTWHQSDLWDDARRDLRAIAT